MTSKEDVIPDIFLLFLSINLSLILNSMSLHRLFLYISHCIVSFHVFHSFLFISLYFTLLRFIPLFFTLQLFFYVASLFLFAFHCTFYFFMSQIALFICQYFTLHYFISLYFTFHYLLFYFTLHCIFHIA